MPPEVPPTANTQSPIVCAYDIRAGGKQINTPCEEELLAKAFQGDDGYRWLHFHIEENDPVPDLPDMKGAPSLVVDALHAAETRPRYTPLASGFLLNLRGVNLNPGADPEDMVSVRLWVTEHLVVSVRRRRLLAVDALRDEITAGNAPPTPARLITDLAFGLTDHMEEVIDDLSDAVDELEDLSLIESRGELRQRLPELRRKAIMLRRYIAPQREAMGRLGIENVPLIGEAERIQLREASDRVQRFVEELDSVRERANVIHDQLTDQRAEAMNRNMLLLSVVAAIFLPLSLLTGLLGVNVGGVPGAGNPGAFWLVVSMLIVLGLVEYVVFKRMKWM